MFVLLELAAADPAERPPSSSSDVEDLAALAATWDAGDEDPYPEWLAAGRAEAALRTSIELVFQKTFDAATRIYLIHFLC